MRILPVTAIAAVALAAVACSSQATASAPAADRAPAPSASPAHAAAPAPKLSAAPSATATATATACRTIVNLLNAADADAHTQAVAKHTQFPGLTVQNLTAASLASDLNGETAQITADETAPGATAALASADRRLAAAVPEVYANFGSSSANAATGQEVAALKTIEGICPGLG